MRSAVYCSISTGSSTGSSRIRTINHRPRSSLYWLAGDVKEPMHFSQRIGHEVPVVVVWLVSRVVASYRVNLIAPFPLGCTSPRKNDYEIELRDKYRLCKWALTVFYWHYHSHITNSKDGSQTR